MVRTVRFRAFGGPEVLSLDEVTVRDPGAGEVRIRVAAFGLNRVEALFRSGAMGPVSFPSRIGYEAAGTIIALGAGVTNWRVGDAVATLYGLSMEGWGTHAEEIVYPADMLVPLASGLLALRGDYFRALEAVAASQAKTTQLKISKTV